MRTGVLAAVYGLLRFVLGYGYLSVYLLFCWKIFVDKKADYPVKVSGVEISPDPVESGKPATFKISATSSNLSLFLLI